MKFHPFFGILFLFFFANNTIFTVYGSGKFADRPPGQLYFSDTVNTNIIHLNDTIFIKWYLIRNTNAPASIRIAFESNDQDFPWKFSYRALSHSDRWSMWSSEKNIDLYNLSTGLNTIEVRLMNSKTNVQLKVDSPVYVRSWFLRNINLLGFIFGIILLSFIGLFLFFRKEKVRIENLLEAEKSEFVLYKAKSVELLQKVMPEGAAQDLMQHGKASSRKYDMVTVLFCDIEGFTRIAQEMNPEILVDKLDAFFFHFDIVISKYNIEKIKTIGDAYMCAGGIPVKSDANPVEIILAGLEMLKYMIDLKTSGMSIWDLRIGVHTGPVIAGIVGQKRASYDIWGDTVNTASRMESSGEANKVNISEETYALVKDYFDCVYRGKMPVKYKGNIGMYFISGIKKEFSLEGNSYLPNEKFLASIQLMKLKNISDIVFGILESSCPDTITFHNITHTYDLYTKAEIYGKAEKLNAQEMVLLKTAALFYDLNYIDRMYGIRILKRSILGNLKDYHYTDDQIETIEQLLNVSEFPPKANNKLESVFFDTLNDFFGRADFIEGVINIFNEQMAFNKVQTRDKWYRCFIGYLNEFEFNTEAGRALREIPAKKQIDLLKKYI